VVDAATSHEVADGRSAAWIASSADGRSVCAVLKRGASACAMVNSLVDDGLSPGIIGRLGEPFHVFGVTTDDVSSVVLVEGDNTRTPVSVSDNFFDVETDDWPTELQWTASDGGHSFGFPAR